jgi:acyl-coenzyme A synthetase/AMP-(fatty) acid ligase
MFGLSNNSNEISCTPSTKCPNWEDKLINLSSALAQQAKLLGAEAALVWPAGILSFAQLETLVNSAAKMLKDAGVEPREKVVVHALPPQLDMVLFLALARIGAVSMTTNKISAVHGSLFEWQIVHGRPEIDSLVPGSRLIVTDESWLDSSAKAPAVTPYEFAEHEPCRILSTSGTTGKEKLAVYSHGALVNKMTAGSAPWVSDLVEFNLMPLGAIGGLATALNGLERGKPYLVLGGDRSEALNFLIRSKIEVLSGSPYQVGAILKSLEQSNLKLKSLKKIRLAGSLTTKRLRDYIVGQHPVEVTSVYGSTECGGVFSKDITTTPNLADLGVLIDGVEVGVYDAGNIPLGDGQVGSLGCKTSSMYLGYLEPDGSLKMELSGGWFFPGDFVVKSGESVTFVGRDSDILNVGGVKIDSTELDEFTRNFEGVLDALSFESEDKSGKPTLAMAVVPGPGFDMSALVGALNQNFPNHAPQILGEVKSIPRTDLGKPQRASLARAFDARAR